MTSANGAAPTKMSPREIDWSSSVPFNVHRETKRRREQADFDGNHRDDAKPDEIHIEFDHDWKHQRNHDEHDRRGIENCAQDQYDKHVNEYCSVEPQTKSLDPLNHVEGDAR